MQSTKTDHINAILSSVEQHDAYLPTTHVICSDADLERWNNEWLAYLSREWALQLTHHSDLPLKPDLPDSALDMIHLSLKEGWELALYCERDCLEGKNVMELGCGCGNLGKQLGRYVKSYLGVDFSTMALQIARLVSPQNCTYIHIADGAELSRHYGQIDTVVGRYFWIHQNFEMARRNLDLIEAFLKPGGRIYADFFWPAPDAEHFVVLAPNDPMSKAYPSAMFRYRADDVRTLIDGRPLKIVRETISVPMERRYVVLERT